MAKSIFYWSILIIVILFTIPFAVNSPVGTLEDQFKTTLYGFAFSGAIFKLLFYTIKIFFGDLILNFKTWVNLGINIRLRGGRNATVRELIFTLFFLGDFVLLGTIPLYINEHYTSANSNIFNATVIEKRITGRGKKSGVILNIRSETGARSSLSSLLGVPNKLELNDFITVVTRKGLLGINYYVAIYKKNGELIYS